MTSRSRRREEPGPSVARGRAPSALGATPEMGRPGRSPGERGAHRGEDRRPIVRREPAQPPLHEASVQREQFEPDDTRERKTGGGEVVHYIARHGESRVAKAAIIGAVPPLMVKTAANPGGLPKDVFDDLQGQLAANRAQFYYDLPAGPFYGYNRPGAKRSEAVIWNWWRQGMMGGAKAHYEGIKAFSETDFTDDLKSIDVPTLVMHGDDDQIVPIADSALLSAKLLKKGTLKVYEKFPHGMCTTHPDIINADLLAFIRS